MDYDDEVTQHDLELDADGEDEGGKSTATTSGRSGSGRSMASGNGRAYERYLIGYVDV